MPLNIVFLRPQNWSRRKNPTTKARLPPSRSSSCFYRSFSPGDWFSETAGRGEGDSSALRARVPE